MRFLKIGFGVGLFAAALVGVAALSLAPVSAGSHDFCPQPPGPPGIDCRGCPTCEDPVVCTVVCQGGPQQKTFSNQCFASCSGYIIRGECTRTGG
jgi:hypothetical protein